MQYAIIWLITVVARKCSSIHDDAVWQVPACIYQCSSLEIMNLWQQTSLMCYTYKFNGFTTYWSSAREPHIPITLTNSCSRSDISLDMQKIWCSKVQQRNLGKRPTCKVQWAGKWLKSSFDRHTHQIQITHLKKNLSTSSCSSTCFRTTHSKSNSPKSFWECSNEFADRSTRGAINLENNKEENAQHQILSNATFFDNNVVWVKSTTVAAVESCLTRNHDKCANQVAS